MEGFANLSAKLMPGTSLSAPHRVEWTEERERAFCGLCVSLCKRVVLYVPLLTDELCLYTDASGMGIGECLHVVREGDELPVAFFSRQLRGAEKRYSVTELESLAIVAVVAHFNVYLERAKVTVRNDHRACLALVKGNAVLNIRLRRMADKLQGHAISVEWWPGKKMSNANGFSHQNWEDEVDKGANEQPLVEFQFGQKRPKLWDWRS